jgi:hypothetical protein
VEKSGRERAEEGGKERKRESRRERGGKMGMEEADSTLVHNICSFATLLYSC